MTATTAVSTSAADPPDDRAAAAADAPHASPRAPGVARAIVGVLLIAAVAFTWHRSFGHADVLAVYASGGKAGGVMSVRGRVVLVVTNIDVGRPWTAQTATVTPDEGQMLYDRFADTPDLNQRWGFVIARQPRDAFNFTGRWCLMFAVPHWALLPVGLPLIYSFAAARLRLWRRRRGGRCLACGYDLRGAAPGATRCPECGTATPTSAAAAAIPRTA